VGLFARAGDHGSVAVHGIMSTEVFPFTTGGRIFLVRFRADVCACSKFISASMSERWKRFDVLSFSLHDLLPKLDATPAEKPPEPSERLEATRISAGRFCGDCVQFAPEPARIWADFQDESRLLRFSGKRLREGPQPCRQGRNQSLPNDDVPSLVRYALKSRRRRRHSSPPS